MVEDDDVTYHVKQQPRDQINLAQINTAAHSLITKERMQKLDLLIHLLSNLPQALVVCGPEGIGKTTLLDALQQRKTDSWRYCLIQGNADLSFEAIHGQLTQCIKADAPVKSLSAAFKQYESQHKQIVLIVDNAGELVPGLIAAIIQYAAANPVLRVVFALTHDELQVKRGSDRAVDDCHIVEIPPLSERQCGDFLQHLSTKPYANLSFKVISEHMIAHIYRNTHGVPGRIIDEISGSSGTKPSGKLKWILVLAVAAAIAIAVVGQWLVSSTNVPGTAPSPVTSTDGENAAKLPGAVAVMQPSTNNDKEVIAPAAEQKVEAIEMAPPQPESEMMPTLPSAQPVIQQQSVPITEGKDAIESVEVNTPKDLQPVTPATKLEATSALLVKQPENKPSAGASQKIAELPIPEKMKIKAQPELVVAQKPSNRQSAVTQQKIVEPPVASPEKPKQVELSRTVNNIEPFAPNKLETPQIPKKPVEVVAAPKEPAIEPMAPQQTEPSRIGSLPIAILPTPRDGGSAANGLEPLPSPSLAAEGSPAQSDNNFTLQLMVLSKQSSVGDILKKYPAMEPDFRAIRTIAKGKEKFILEYGSYPDAASANKARESLPFEFRKALVRKIVR